MTHQETGLMALYVTIFKAYEWYPAPLYKNLHRYLELFLRVMRVVESDL
jgi:hypothetical protein